MASRPGIPVRQRRVSNELRVWRKKAGFTCKEVADALEWSITKVSRMETGARGLFVDDVAVLLGLYRVPAQLRQELLDLVRQGEESNWQRLQTGKLPTNWQDLIRFEADAALIYSFEPLVVPGLLQTPEYARAILDATDNLTESEAEMLVSARMTRHAILTKPDGPALHAVIDEAVLRRPVGGPGVMRRQLQHLITCASASNVTVRVLPFSSGATPGVKGPLLILEYTDQANLVYLEHRENSAFLEEDQYVERARLAMRRLRDAALVPIDSMQLVASTIDHLP